MWVWWMFYSISECTFDYFKNIRYIKAKWLKISKFDNIMSPQKRGASSPTIVLHNHESIISFVSCLLTASVFHNYYYALMYIVSFSITLTAHYVCKVVLSCYVKRLLYNRYAFFNNVDGDCWVWERPTPSLQQAVSCYRLCDTHFVHLHTITFTPRQFVRV